MVKLIPMASAQTTCWTLIQAASQGESAHREAFTRRYEPAVRAYLLARWKGSPLTQELDDTCQEFFLECFRDGGPLVRVEKGRAGGFRAFLFGIVRNVARRCEQRSARQHSRASTGDIDLEYVESDDSGPAEAFGRAWAEALLNEAAERHAENARQAGPAAEKRIELLRLRFREGLPIREIAKDWEVDAARLHREYAKARDEYSQALYDVVLFHHPEATSAEVQRECLDLLAVLS